MTPDELLPDSTFVSHTWTKLELTPMPFPIESNAMLLFAVVGSAAGEGVMMTTKVSLNSLQTQSGNSYEKKFESNDIVRAFVGTRGP